MLKLRSKFVDFVHCKIYSFFGLTVLLQAPVNWKVGEKLHDQDLCLV